MPTTPRLASSGPGDRPSDTACIFAALAYSGGVCWLAMFTAFPIYLFARRRSPFVAWHAMQALTLGVLTLGLGMLLSLLAIACGALVAFAGDLESSLGAILTSVPLVVVFGAAQWCAWLGMAEAVCGRRTPLPGVHGIADRTVELRGEP